MITKTKIWKLFRCRAYYAARYYVHFQNTYISNFALSYPYVWNHELFGYTSKWIRAIYAVLQRKRSARRPQRLRQRPLRPAIDKWPPDFGWWPALAQSLQPRTHRYIELIDFGIWTDHERLWLKKRIEHTMYMYIMKIIHINTEWKIKINESC